MQWVPLYPLIGLYTMGVLGNWFGVAPHYSWLIAGCILIMQFELLVLCFIKKHQVISKISKSLVFHKCLEYYYIAMCAVSIPVGGAFFHSIRLTKDEQWVFLKKTVPQFLSQFQTLPNFEVYEKTPKLYLGFALFGLLIIFCVLSLFVLILNIFRMMRKLKIRMSAISFQKHQNAVRSLTVQSATCLFCMAPPVLLSIFVYLEVENSQILTELCIVWIASHSSINMIGLLFFFDPYRSFVLKEFEKQRQFTRQRISGRVSSNTFPVV